MPALPDDALPAVRDAIARGNLIEAIKIYRERTGAGLKESKDAVERIAAGLRTPEGDAAPATGPLRDEDLTQIHGMLQRGEKINAIKVYRERTGVGLKEAKDAVEALEKRPAPVPEAVPAGQLTQVPASRGGCLGILLLVVGAAIVMRGGL